MILNKYIPREVLEKALKEIETRLGAAQASLDELMNEKAMIEKLLNTQSPAPIDRKHLVLFEAPSMPDKIKGLILLDGPQKVADIFSALANAGHKVSKNHIATTLTRSKSFKRISDGRWDVVN